MDINSMVKIFGDLAAKLSPEFCEKHFGRIALSILGIVAIPLAADCIKYCVDKATYCACYRAAAENGLLSGNAICASETILIDLPATNNLNP